MRRRARPRRKIRLRVREREMNEHGSRFEYRRAVGQHEGRHLAGRITARNSATWAGPVPTQIRSKRAPISSSAICTAREPEPGRPYSLYWDMLVFSYALAGLCPPREFASDLIADDASSTTCSRTAR